MSDLVVKFSQCQFRTQDYYGHVERGWENDFASDKEARQKYKDLKEHTNNHSVLCRDVVVLQVIRISGGERSGKGGMLELVSEPELNRFPYSKVGLHFTPLSEDHWHPVVESLRVKFPATCGES